MATMRLLLFLALYSVRIHVISSLTDQNDAAVMMILRDSWKNTPSSWEHSDDPCGVPWEGVNCTGARVTELRLSAMGLIGELSTGYIGQLDELTSLDVSFNPGITGRISPQISFLLKLNTLNLAGCSFSGSIPDQLGDIEQLTFLALNSNNLSGTIPSALGQLSNLYLLDLSDNQLTGPLPISTSTSPGGLDLLLKAEHFHLSNNQLSGSIPPELFSSEMRLIHLFLDGNKLTGVIPMTLGLVQTFEMVRLNRNTLTGSVPSNLNNLTNVNELNLANNNLTGLLPDLTGMNSLNYVDLSNNSFDPSVAPLWFSTLPTLTTLVMEFGSLQGPVPENLFSLPELQEVKLKYNTFNGTLNMGDNISLQLELVDLQNNQISHLTIEEEYKDALILKGNPICSGSLSNTTWCQ
ncbi:leucine-rich repeat receptor protein kinase HPCA1-like [Rosa chinensis]|uniref:leucine-rich repeat receptor protein kinase HPCA1-like n=1 Tax=Rosa chinensis TaxID=74649 RepID=UPI000D08BEF9|nr:leucine-rich repeat receptor protein kinase HPCA1-like [Rosa chinensis]